MSSHCTLGKPKELSPACEDLVHDLELRKPDLLSGGEGARKKHWWKVTLSI
jgi:hypothetical protein